MIRLIEALNYRCLRYIRQPLERFHVLVGSNASGKTTFLDVIAFLGRMVSDGLDAAIGERTTNFADLLWRREGTGFELAIEADIHETWIAEFNGKFDVIRYEVAIGYITPLDQFEGRAEQIFAARDAKLQAARAARRIAAATETHAVDA